MATKIKICANKKHINLINVLLKFHRKSEDMILNKELNIVFYKSVYLRR